MPDCGEDPFAGRQLAAPWCGRAVRWFVFVWLSVLFVTWGLSL